MSAGLDFGWLADGRRFQVGDIITVVVDEYTSASADRATSALEDRRTDAGLGLRANTTVVDGTVGSFLGNESMQRGRDYRQDRLNSEVSVRVTEVENGGGLRIEGTKILVIDEHEQEVTVRGVIRPQDITPGQHDRVVADRRGRSALRDGRLAGHGGQGDPGSTLRVDHPMTSSFVHSTRSVSPVAFRRVGAGVLALTWLAVCATAVSGQGVRVRDLTSNAGELPVRLVGYGLVVGLDGTGDRVFGGPQGSMTVRSVANLLRNVGIDVPERYIRTRNAAAVLVTAEASRYTREGGRFDVSVASVGDATSLRGGQLWMTPLRASVGGEALAVAQGTVLLPDVAQNGRYLVETSAVLTDAAVSLASYSTGAAAPPSHLLLRDPDLATARAISEAINQNFGADVATVEDPGAIALTLPQDDPLGTLVALGELEIATASRARVVVDASSGVVAAGGDITVGAAVVSHDWLTLSIAPQDTPAPFGADAAAAGAALPPGAVRAEPGIQVQSLAEALHSVGASAEIIGSVFRSPRSVGALHAEVVVR